MMTSSSTSATHPASPSSSPRLPSPPPLTEVQFGPKSPGLSGDNVVLPKAVLGDAAHGSSTSTNDDGSGSAESKATRRIRPGTKAEEMSAGPPLIPLSELDSAFQLQEHLKALYQSHTQPSDLNHTVPITRTTAFQLSTPPEGVDRSLWLYELCRLLTNKLNTIIVGLFTDEPPCSASTCAEMRASEWQYLCAVHDPPKPCCAIDYSCHTLDWAANMLTSTKYFPSRLTLEATPGGNSAGGGGGGGGGQAQQQGLRNLTNVCRRLYRIFAHAWYQHRSVFWQVESQTGLYVFFKTVCDVYQLIPEDNYTVPPEAEGLENTKSSVSVTSSSSSSSSGPSSAGVPAEATTILKRPPLGTAEIADRLILDTNESAKTTRRHMSTLSTGSSLSAGAVTTVPEEEEEDDDATKGKDTGRQNVNENVKEEERTVTEQVVEEEKQQSQPTERMEAEGQQGGIGGESKKAAEISSEKPPPMSSEKNNNLPKQEDDDVKTVVDPPPPPPSPDAPAPAVAAAPAEQAEPKKEEKDDSSEGGKRSPLLLATTSSAEENIAQADDIRANDNEESSSSSKVEAGKEEEEDSGT